MRFSRYQPVVKSRLGRDDCGAGSQFVSFGDRIEAHHPDTAFVGVESACSQTHGRGLSSSVGTEQDGDGSLGDFKG